MQKKKAADFSTASVARKLAVILHRMWVDGTEFNWSNNREVAAFGVTVDETDIPMFRQHGGDRDQAKWRGRILRADQFAGFRIVPERVRNELRIDH
jgi:hypothetical protein